MDELSEYKYRVSIDYNDLEKHRCSDWCHDNVNEYDYCVVVRNNTFIDITLRNWRWVIVFSFLKEEDLIMFKLAMNCKFV